MMCLKEKRLALTPRGRKSIQTDDPKTEALGNTKEPTVPGCGSLVQVTLPPWASVYPPMECRACLSDLWVLSDVLKSPK